MIFVLFSKVLRDIEDIQSGKKDHDLMDMMRQIKKIPVLPPQKIEGFLPPFFFFSFFILF